MASSAPAAPSNVQEEGMAEADAEADATQATARLEADVEALLRLGVPVAKLEELYGTSLVCSIAKAMVKSSEGEATGRLAVGKQLLQRSISSKRDALEDQGFVDSMLASLMQDPDPMLMDPLMLVPLKDPVVLSSGFVVDRGTAFPDGSSNLRFQHCPFSREPLKRDVYPLVFLRDKVKEWKLDRLNQAVVMAEELVSSKQDPEFVERVFGIAEQYMDEVGDATYIHVARRLAEAERKSTVVKGPEKILRIHQRLSRVLSAEELPAQVTEAMVEFSAEAQRQLDAGDAEAAASWLCQDVQSWLERPEIRAHWSGTDRHRAWLKLQLRVARARADDGAIRRWLQATYLELKRGGLPEELAQWLREEGLEEEEFLFAAPFRPDVWQHRGTSWADAASGLVRVGPGYVEYTGPSLNPVPGSNWFLEVAFMADSLRYPAYLNVIFSQHGSGTGWEVRVCKRHGIELVFTTEQGGHNEYTCGRGDQTECVGRWVHVAVCFEHARSETTVFVNGEQTPAHEVHGAFKPSQHPARIGRNPCWIDRYICGHVAFAHVEHDLPATPGSPLAHRIAAIAQQRLSCLPAADQLEPAPVQSDGFSDQSDGSSELLGDYNSDSVSSSNGAY